ncbi:MAG: hypothetical protein GY761_05265 [Hyphomicrobiales bacterium]|nr:hypothetical protein [Hyphomicrobiales bacterium]
MKGGQMTLVSLLEFGTMPLDRFLFTRNHLTVYSRLLARHDFRRGLVDHKKSITLSRKRE